MTSLRTRRMRSVATTAAVTLVITAAGCKQKHSPIGNVGMHQQDYKDILTPNGEGFTSSEQELERRLSIYLSNAPVGNPSGTFEVAVGNVLVARKVEAMNGKLDKIATLLEQQNRLLEHILQQQRLR